MIRHVRRNDSAHVRLRGRGVFIPCAAYEEIRTVRQSEMGRVSCLGKILVPLLSFLIKNLDIVGAVHVPVVVRAPASHDLPSGVALSLLCKVQSLRYGDTR